LTRGASGQSLTVNGLRLNVSVEGAGHPILLINGLGANVEMWRPFRDALAGRTIAFDAPGIGRSQAPLFPPSMKKLAHLALGVLERLEVDCVDVLGYSFGGAVAQELARQAPTRVRRLVLVATSPGWGGVPGAPSALTAVLTPLRYYSRAYYDFTNRLMATGPLERRPRVPDEHARARFRSPPSIRGYAWQLWAGWMWTSMPWLHELTHPTLVVAGEADRLVPPANSVILARRLPNARLILAPGEGHLMLFDDDSRSCTAIRDFLAAPHLAGSPAWRSGSRVTSEGEPDWVRDAPWPIQPLAIMSSLARSIWST
jgi:pimeloyl-ACP methyl ester carboxylesterase